MEIKLEFRPEFILIDFEYAAIKAFIFCFPNAKILGCWFHFGQCLFRKLVELCFKVAYGEDEDLKSWFKGVVALALLQQIEDIENLLNSVKLLVQQF